MSYKSRLDGNTMAQQTDYHVHREVQIKKSEVLSVLSEKGPQRVHVLNVYKF